MEANKGVVKLSIVAVMLTGVLLAIVGYSFRNPATRASVKGLTF